MRMGTNIIMFKEKRFIGVILYIFSLQILLSLLTNKDILLLKQKISAYMPVVWNFLESVTSNQISKVWELIPIMLITGFVLVIAVAGMVLVMMLAGYIVSLILKIWN